jgi:hypothetical protein
VWGLGWSWGSQEPFVKGLEAEKKVEIWGLPEENARLHNFSNSFEISRKV